MSDTYSLDTPEGLRLDYEVAGLGSRFLGALVDTSLLILGLFALMLAALSVMGAVSALRPLTDLGRGLSSDAGLIGWVVAVAVLLVVVLIWGYYVFFEMIWSGQSPGKRMAGLRVVGQDGYPVTFAASLTRNLVRLIDFLPFYYGIGMLTMFLDSKSRRLGDFVAGTIVVKERASMSADDLLTDFDEALEPGVTIPNVERLSARERHLIDHLLSRNRELAPARQRELARSVSTLISARLDYDRGTLSPVRFLWRVQQTYRPGAATPRIAIDNVERLTDADYTVVREYFLRRGTLPPGRSKELARKIASVIAGKLELDASDLSDAEAFLRQVGDSYRGTRR